jgi:hypothetical protein
MSAKGLATYITEGRFEPLKAYLNGVTVGDLVNFEDEDFLETVSKKHRLLMKIFLRSTREKIESQTAGQEYLDGDVLDVHGRACTSVFFGNSWVPVNRVPVQQLLLSLSPEDQNNAKVLDLSGNDLLTDDLIHIDNIVEKLQLEQIDLSYNRMVKSDNPEAFIPLKRWLREKQIKVHVLFNYFIDSKEFIEGLDDTELSNLLWIPPNWLEGRGWTSRFASQARTQLVYDTHKSWYSTHTRRGAGTGHTKWVN